MVLVEHGSFREATMLASQWERKTYNACTAATFHDEREETATRNTVMPAQYYSFLRGNTPMPFRPTVFTAP